MVPFNICHLLFSTSSINFLPSMYIFLFAILLCFSFCLIITYPQLPVRAHPRIYIWSNYYPFLTLSHSLILLYPCLISLRHPRNSISRFLCARSTFSLSPLYIAHSLLTAVITLSPCSSLCSTCYWLALSCTSFWHSLL